ncbi:hypothetical protein TREMEDRAFT_68217 [Tremella mesenterica DSM 1558]|uniref:uncharacterized protein n=1 Tax=Tremella mesenterica (strain ATCC 24925 / CBS 8224 / DSM 1558 / NBRC 9311 / NRRL Y-6157 / RJB 2259-6 / UBC 559-6) TaxID=578456 RepID=UPI0003F49AD8|nr:uncharacterized protein TREMEDRAFT_68217 [Tremella mesenterica DSM 1558]EIW70778.1 hypothetical protein TREMEDRAFT_68217 [Tremella mesenterica DSM 1558]
MTLLPGPFHLQPVLTQLYKSQDLLDLSSPAAQSSPFRSSPTSSPDRSRPESVPSDQKIEVTCVEGYGPNLYVARTDGVVEWWVCDGSAGTSQAQGWSLKNKYSVFPRRPVSKIVLLPKVGRAFILSDGTVHPVNLPNLEAVPSTVIPTIRGVVTVTLDDDELDWTGPESEDKSSEMTMVVVRRKGLAIYKVGQRMTLAKEIPLPSAPTQIALTSTFLCASIPSADQSTYSIIDLSDASLTEVLPVSQLDPTTLDFDPNPNIVVIPGENEFLVTSFTGVSTMGVFLNGQGDPVRGTMEWPDHPLSLAIEANFIIALLKNGTIRVHRLDDLDKPIQIVTLDLSMNATALSYSPYGVEVRDLVRDERLKAGRMQLLSGKLAPPNLAPIRVHSGSPPRVDLSNMSVDAVDENMLPSLDVIPPVIEPSSGSGLTPPSSPPDFGRRPIFSATQTSLLQTTAPAVKDPFSTVITETVVFGPNTIMSLSPASIILRVERLCAERRMEEATAAVDEERRRGRRGEVDQDKVNLSSFDTTHLATMRYLHLYLASHLLLEAMFERAGEYFSRGKVDPRLIVRLFPAFRGKVIGSAEDVEVYEGLREVVLEMPTVDQIIANSIKRNYSPHVSPNSQSAPETTELRDALYDDAKTMLTELLRRTRASRRKGGARGVDSRKIDIVIDTTLSKLMADQGITNELLALLASPNDVVLSELEPFLEKRPYVLATVLRQQGRIDRVLEILRGIAESQHGDPLCDDPIEEIYQMIEGVTDPVIWRKYVLWLVARDAHKGLSLIMSPNPAIGKIDDISLLSDLRQISPEVSFEYLEHVVVNKKSSSRDLHEDLLTRLIDTVLSLVQDDGVKYHLEELEADYRLQIDPDPFPVYLAEVAPPTPIKFTRLKLMLFLQGSPFYDLQDASQRFEGQELLKYELAVILGRLGETKRALSLLARDVGDGMSAQTYCTQGEFITIKTAKRVASRLSDLAPWANIGEIGRKKRGSVDPQLQENSVMELLGVYMRDGDSTIKQASNLLNAQSMHLDMERVLRLVPDDWPLEVISGFYQRGLRRGLHEKASGGIMKAIAAGQNLQVGTSCLISLPVLLYVHY